MQPRIKNTHFQMTAEVQEYLDKKIASLETFFDAEDPTVQWDIELEKMDDRLDTDKIFRAELNLKMKGELFRAEGVGTTMLAALDEAKDDLKQELRRRNSKTHTFVKESGRRLKNFLRGWSR